MTTTTFLATDQFEVRAPAASSQIHVRHQDVHALDELDAEVVIVAVGTETRALVAPLGVDLPVHAEYRHLFLIDPINERLLEPLVVAPELAFAVKHLADGRVLASDLAGRGDVDAGRTQWRATIRAGIEQLVPRLEYVSFSTLVSGVYDVTPDHQPILGPIPGHDNSFVACGFSGHGFVIAPAVARITADAVEGRRDEAIDVLGVDRFATGRLVPEPQLV